MATARREGEILRSLAANIQRFRREHGRTQFQLAEAAGVELRTLQRIERAQINFGVVTLIRLAEAFGVAADDLVRPAKFQPARRGRPPTSPKADR